MAYQEHVFRALDVDGDGTGNYSANADHSGAAEIYYIQPPAGEVYTIERMLVMIEDAGVPDADKYGNNLVLTNGIIVRVSDSSGVKESLTAFPVKTNAHWGAQCYDVDLKDWGTGNEFVLVRWTFAKSGKPIVLDGDNGEKLEVVLEDDFTDLVEHYFVVQGWKGKDKGVW